jgi:pentatricopeptide repeat protein
VALKEGRQIHNHIIQSGYESDVFVGNSLVDMYVECGSIEDAQRVFHKMPMCNVVSWSAMIWGHVKCRQGQKALELYQQMQVEGVKPEPVTFMGVLNACASVGWLEKGSCVHELIIQRGYESNLLVGSSLVDMYAKCGSIEDAQSVFNKMSTHNAVTWNAMLAGYAIHGHAKQAFEHFEPMCEEGVEMGVVTFVSLQSTCSHAGLVDEGAGLF